MTMHKALHYMCQEKNEEEELPALKMPLTHQYNDPKPTYKNAEEVCLKPRETTLTILGEPEWKWRENKNGKKNDSTDVLSD